MMCLVRHWPGHRKHLLTSEIGSSDWKCLAGCAVPAHLGSNPGPATLQLRDPGKLLSLLVPQFPLLLNRDDSLAPTRWFHREDQKTEYMP